MGYKKVFYSGTTEFSLIPNSEYDIVIEMHGEANTPSEWETLGMKLSHDDVVELIKDLQNMIPPKRGLKDILPGKINTK